MKTKTKVAVIFGGRSTEHDISRISAYSIIKNIDRDLFDVVMIGITKQGEWLPYEGSAEALSDGSWEKEAKPTGRISLEKGVAAIKAAEYYECQFGAAVIEGPKDDYGCFTATITISNKKTATIRTLSSIPDEDHDDFMNTVVTEFFLMLANELENTPVVTEEKENYIAPVSVIHGSRILLYIILLATASFLTYVAVSFADLPFFS